MEAAVSSEPSAPLYQPKCKGTLHPRTGHEGPEGEQRYSFTLSLLSALTWGGGWSTPRPGRFTPGKDPVGTRQPGLRSPYSDSLQAGRPGDRIPVEARFSAPVQTGSEAHPASYTVGTGSFLGVKRRERVVDHLPHLLPRLKKQ